MFKPHQNLPWVKDSEAHYKAEPAPGLVYRVYPADDGFGFMFFLPGSGGGQALMASTARHACENHWGKVYSTFYETWRESLAPD